MRTLTAILLLSLAGCGAKSPTEIREGVAGTYTIEQVNGAALPYQNRTGWALDFFGGSLVLRANGTATLTSEVLYYSRVDGELVPDQSGRRTSTAQGHWTLNGSALTLIQSEPVGGDFMDWNGDVLGHRLALTRAPENSGAGQVGISTMTLVR